MDRRLYAILSPNLKEQFANKKLFLRDDGVYELEDGLTVKQEVVDQMQTRGMLRPPTTDTITSIAEVVEGGKSQLMAREGEAKPMYRVGYEAPYRFAGELVYQKTDGMFATQKGTPLTPQEVQRLAQEGHIQMVSDEMLRPANPYLISEATRTVKDVPEEESALAVFGKVFTIVLVGSITIYVVVAMYLIIFRGYPFGGRPFATALVILLPFLEDVDVLWNILQPML